VALVIAYESNTARLLKAIEGGWDDSDPNDVAFWLPDGAKKGDRVLYFVGGRFQYFFGSGRIESNERTGRSGLWKGEPYWYTSKVASLEEPVPGRDVFVATGFKIPRRECIVPVQYEEAVWKAARGKPLIRTELAVEGAGTEARSKYRNPQLRQTALQDARGICEGCGVNYGNKHGGLGRHCLVVHHKKQLKDTDQPRETKLSELAVVCANCHMIIHANRDKALKIDQLRKILKK
jgi:hypothetical protein